MSLLRSGSSSEDKSTTPRSAPPVVCLALCIFFPSEPVHLRRDLIFDRSAIPAENASTSPPARGGTDAELDGPAPRLVFATTEAASTEMMDEISIGPHAAGPLCAGPGLDLKGVSEVRLDEDGCEISDEIDALPGPLRIYARLEGPYPVISDEPIAPSGPGKTPDEGWVGKP